MARILVVDDRAPNRDLLTAILTSTGHEVLEATDGAEGLEAAIASRPDLVISDILMPRMDGFELARRIREDPALRDTRVIFLSAAYVEPESRALARACGVAHFIMMPIEPAALMTRVANVLNGRAPAEAPAGPPGADFERMHLRLLTNKLAEKVAELEALNAALERRVEERTTGLTAANAELEAFTYAASHDLRAPVRAIVSFSQILLEPTEGIAGEAWDLLERILNAGRDMNAMIDDLLELSTTSRAELRRSRVDLSALATSIGEELARAAPHRRVDLVVEPGLDVVADRGLMTIVLKNLLGNARKFTSGRSAARIEFGAAPGEAGETVFTVRDNGAGFDPGQSARLFKPFQRLHGRSDFPGTGIGLATVERIVRRHGGRVWAEGAPERGAAFYFTVPRGRDPDV